MRAFLCLVLVLFWIPTTAGAAIVTLPVVGGEVPRALAIGADGRGAVVTETSSASQSATQSVITVPAGKRATFAKTRILDSVQRQDGGVDLLVRRGANSLSRAQLTFRRVMPSGRVYDLWSHDSAATVGALARGTHQTVAVWLEGARIQTITRPDGGLPTRARTIALGVSGVVDLDLALDDRGRLTVAATTALSGLVVAAVSKRGAVLRRQVFKRASGLVHMAVTVGGRVGALVEDTARARSRSASPTAAAATSAP